MRLWGKALVATVATATLLAGCTSSGDDKGSSGAGSATPGAPVVGGVLAEQTIDTPTRENRKAEEPLGGTMTVTVRSVTVSEGRTVVTWALRWDDPGAADGASASLDDFIKVAPPVLVDGTALKYYYPLCNSDYHKGVLAQQNCSFYALYSPRTLQGPDLTNHQTMEAWAIFPEVGKDTATVDLSLASGLPAFAALPVTRP